MSSGLSADFGAHPKPLPSLPPSPTTSEDLSRAPAWIDLEEEDQTTPQKKKDKGKGKQVANPDVEEGAESGEISEEEEARNSYPPTTEDTSETRRIEENLRRWELNERQRRKAARESAQLPSRSLVGDVTRRASLLWPRKSPHASHPSRSGRSDDLGNHAALKSTEDVDFVPLEEIEGSPYVSANSSPSGSPATSNDPANPFKHPSDLSSPFDDTHEQHAVMGTLSAPPIMSKPTGKSKAAAYGARPALLASSSSSFKQPPTPQPLDLPPPLTPPPPNTAQPPSPIASPSLLSNIGARIEPEEPKETRWWHDWLCGCSEGADRGGDNQAGKTNPFE